MEEEKEKVFLVLVVLVMVREESKTVDREGAYNHGVLGLVLRSVRDTMLTLRTNRYVLLNDKPEMNTITF